MESFFPIWIRQNELSGELVSSNLATLIAEEANQHIRYSEAASFTEYP